MHPSLLQISDYDYPLPPEKIAVYPLPQRDASKLLVYKKGSISEGRFTDLPERLPAGTLLVFNNTRVVQARLLFEKTTGGMIEVFVLDSVEVQPFAVALQETQFLVCKCYVGGASKWKHGQVLQKQHATQNGLVQLSASVCGKQQDWFEIRFEWNPDIPFLEILHLFGGMPIPPYLHRKADASDETNYQTVYAAQAGSVAAPTAGLHFTEAVLGKLQAQGVHHKYITLHVGAGTFKPVTSAQMQGHTMHEETMELSVDFLQELSRWNGPIIPVGTTALRTLESLYWMGVKVHNFPNLDPAKLPIAQWEVYDALRHTLLSRQEAMDALTRWMQRYSPHGLLTRTAILIAPGYTFKVASGLITNFHQPKSTLILLVSALLGDDWKRVYQFALENEFRFLSYGDSSLLLP